MTTLAPPAAAALARRYLAVLAILARVEAELAALVRANGGPMTVAGVTFSLGAVDAGCYNAQLVDEWLVEQGYGPLVAGLRAMRSEAAEAGRLRVTEEAM